ncbi:MAG: FKBP-type peptidyl-prolyl cis-trans isomerase [Myxococcota bacterium]
MTSILQKRTTLRAALIAIALVPFLSGVACSEAAPKTDDEKAFYTIGASIAGQLDMAKPISAKELDWLVQGLRDAVGDETLAVDLQAGSDFVRAMIQQRQAQATQREVDAGAAFLAEEAAKKGAEKTASGLIYTELRAGKGAHPTATDQVRVHYHGTLRDGTVFDSSVDRNEPAEFPLNRVIACWTEGVAMMKEGGKSRLVCPSEIAYGDRATGAIPAGAALTFEVELLEILN